MSCGERDYLEIARHYEACLELHGDTHRGVDWPNAEDAAARYRVMLDVIRNPEQPCSLLDFGCGASHLYEYMCDKGFSHIAYSGLDISEKFITLSRKKYPGNTYYCQDFLRDGALPMFDYVIMNGVFTEKLSLSQDSMKSYVCSMLRAVYAKARGGIAVNFMSKHVDWERDDLFHLPFDELVSFVTKHISRHFVIRNDYGLYEYTMYIYRNALP